MDFEPEISGEQPGSREWDAICERFEEALKLGEQTAIRTVIEEVDAEARPELFKRLLRIQQSAIENPDERPDLPALIAQYPEFASEILQVVSEEPRGAETIRMAPPPADAGAAGILREIQPEKRYRIGGEVARGGMGAIHLAEDASLRRRVAVKSMLSPQASSEELIRFIEEAQITGQLDHPGIVPVYELGVDEELKPFYSMKFVRGRDLQAVIAAIRIGDAAVLDEFPLHRLLSVFDRVCDAVSFAHAHGVIHRDLKPDNIRIGEFGEVVVMDWGLAKLLGHPEDSAPARGETRQVSSAREADESGSFVTLAGSVMGTPQYMAPEQAAGNTAELDARADIYALGAILYEILTFTPAIKQQADVYQTLASVTSGKIRSPLRLNRAPPRRRSEQLPHCPSHRVPEALAKVAMKALALDREDRYGSVRALQREIEAWLGGFATEVENAGFFRQSRLFIGRNRIASVAAAAIAVLLVGGSAVNLHQRNVAVTALANYEEAERQKLEQARRSAPAYLKSALALEQQGDFENALITTEGALGLDPELAEGHRIHGLLLARAGRYGEALDAVGRLPAEGTDGELCDLLGEIVADPETNRLSALAKIAGECGMPATGSDVLAQSWEILKGKYSEGLPIWRAKLEKVWGKFSRSSSLTISPESGLTLSLTKTKENVVTSLEPLRGIPLEALRLGNIKVSDLTPLRGMPLRRFEAAYAPIESLAGLEEAPLDYLKITGTGSRITNTMLDPLRGKKIDYIWFEGTEIETEALAEIQCQEFRSNDVNSFAFVRHQKSLNVLRIFYPKSGLDWSPVLECPTLWSLHPLPNVHQITEPIWIKVADNDLEGARESIGVLRDSIQNPACEPTRKLLDLMEFIVTRKLTGAGELEKGKTLVAPVGDGRMFARLELAVSGTLTVTSSKRPSLILEAFDKLDVGLASLHSKTEQEVAMSLPGSWPIMIGGLRTIPDPVWRWRDGSPWAYHPFAYGEVDKKINGPVPNWGRYWAQVREDGSWINDDKFGRNILIQFPAEWVERKQPD